MEAVLLINSGRLLSAATKSTRKNQQPKEISYENKNTQTDTFTTGADTPNFGIGSLISLQSSRLKSKTSARDTLGSAITVTKIP